MLNQLKRKFLNLKRIIISLLLVSIAGCASTPKVVDIDSELAQWLKGAELYKQKLTADHPDHIDNVLAISAPMREAINVHFADLPSSLIALRMADWLVDNKDGHGMHYNVNSNLTPAEAFEKREGNCLTFTILLTTMAAELGIELLYNEVDLPDVWDQDEEETDARVVLYRHINAITNSTKGQYVFDLAIEDYDASYPQRVIPSEHAIALLHNNKAIEALKKNDLENAMHYLKLAVSNYPDNPDIFINLGAVFKYVGETNLAEESMLYALKLDKNNHLAANKLERWYRLDGQQTKALKYKRLARASRNRNPYYQYARAEDSFKSNDFKAARRYIRRAKYLYDQDSRFFWLSSRVERMLGKHVKALRELVSAYELAKTEEQLNIYKTEAVELAVAMKNNNTKNSDTAALDKISESINTDALEVIVR